MEIILNNIDQELPLIESQIPHVIYNIFCNIELDKNVKQLKYYDEQLIQYMLKLDGITVNSDHERFQRKEMIIKIQKIQKAIDKTGNKSAEIYELQKSQLLQINDLIKEKNHLINKLNGELDNMKSENYQLKDTLRIIHQKSNY